MEVDYASWNELIYCGGKRSLSAGKGKPYEGKSEIKQYSEEYTYTKYYKEEEK